MMRDMGGGVMHEAAVIARALEPVRAAGGLKARYVFADGATRIDTLTEYGGYRLRFPTTHAAHVESSQINTGGGVAGGDRLEIEIDVGTHGQVVHSAPTAERIYRSMGPSARIDIKLNVGSRARLDWLPQETILYSGARLDRRFEVDMATDACLLMVEMVVFGRVAHGEVPGHGLLRDRWHIRRGGRLVFAEFVRVEGHMAEIMSRPAVAAGARSAGLVIALAPDVEDRIGAVRTALAGARSDWGASAWNRMLTARFLGTPEDVRRDIIRATEVLSGRAMPRVWMT